MSGQWIKRLISPPVMSDKENADTAFLLHSVTLWGIPVLLIFVILRTIGGESLVSGTHAFLGMVILALLAGRIALQSGYVRGTGRALIFLAWAGVTYLAWSAKGLQNNSLTPYLTLLLASGLLLGELDTLILFFISVAAIWGLAYADFAGFRVTDNPQESYILARDLTFNYFLSTVFVYYMIRTLRKLLSRGQMEIKEHERNEITLKQQAAYLSSLHETTLGIINRLELRPLLESILTRACELVDTYNGLIELVVPDGSALQLELGIGIPGPHTGHLTYKNQGLTGRVWASGETLIVNNYAEWEHRDMEVAGNFKGIIGLPLKSGDEVFGVLALLCVKEERQFKTDQVILLERFASLASLAIQNARLYEDSRKELMERRQIQNALHESEEKFRRVFHSSPIAICITELENGRLLEANYAYWDLTGLNPDDALGKTSDELKLWDTPDERNRFVENLKAKGSYYNPEDSFKDENGNLKRVISFYELIPIGREQHILSMFYDMSEQHKMTDALRESETRMRALLEAIPDMILELTLDGLITNMIPPKDRGKPMSSENFIGRRVYEVFSEKAASQTLFAVERAIRDNHMNVFEFEDFMMNRTRAMEARVIANTPNSALMMIRDITQRRWVETEREKLIEELETRNKESETLRDSLASIVSTLEFSEIIQRVLDQIQLVVPYDSASIWRVEGNIQKFITGRNLPKEFENSQIDFETDETNSALPILKGDVPYILNGNVQEELPDFQTPPHTYVNSWLAVPLRVKEKVIGVIALDGKKTGQFTERHAQLAVTYANQVAIALENTRLFAELQDELKRQIALRNASMAISSSLHLDQVLNEICKQMCIVNDGTSAYIAKYDEDSSFYFTVAEYTGINANPKEMVSDLGVPYYKKDGAWLFDETIISEFALIHSDDEDLSPLMRNILSQYGGRTILYLPLYVQGRLQGHAELWDSRDSREFTQDEISFCRTLSQQAAVAIANANLFEQLQNELKERKVLIAELEAKNAELERFTYTVSHDLKSPLFTIRGFLGYLEQDALAGNRERLESDMQRITDATERMQQLLNDLLELSRIGRLMNEPLEIPFEELAREAVEIVQGRIMEHNVAVHIDAGMPTVYGDRQRLLEVVQNLVDNAAKFMGGQTEPRIEIGWDGEEDGRPIFFVSDNGMGIPSIHHDRIFGLFNKLDVKVDGTGVGLALVKRIIEFHGGRIWVESEAGRGSTFFFTLGVENKAV